MGVVELYEILYFLVFFSGLSTHRSIAKVLLEEQAETTLLLFLFI